MPLKILLPASLALGLCAMAAGAASATCKTVHESNDAAGNSITLRQDDCGGIFRRDDGGRPAAFAMSDDAEADDGFRNGRILQDMVRADPPEATSASFLDRIFTFLFGAGKDVTPSRKTTHKPGDQPRVQGLAEGDLLCTVTVKGEGRMKRLGIMVAANKPVAADANAQISVIDGNEALYSITTPIALAAGDRTPIDVVTTTAGRRAVIEGSVEIGGSTIACH